MPDDERIIGSGRDSDIIDLGGGRVLRRPKAPRDLSAEAVAMEVAAAAGYPTVRVHEVRPDGLVLDRVDGVDMLADLARAPWRLAAHASLLARLHRDLAAIEAPADLPPRHGGGRHLVHLDLHPANVLITPGGDPVVIDWANAGRGPSGADAASTWLVLAAAQPPEAGWLSAAVTRLGRRAFLSRFLAGIDRGQAIECLHAAIEARRHDPNLSSEELATMEQVAARHGVTPG